MIFISSKASDGNMDFRFGNKKEVSNNRNKFFRKLEIKPKDVTEVEQIHGSTIIIADQFSDSKTEADGLITNRTDIFLMLKTADCMAVGFYDPKHHCIGLAHIGRQGLQKEIIKNMMKILKENFNTDPKDIIIQISPSIGPCCYRMDIWKEAEKQLEENNVPKKTINNPEICTYHNNDYFSHRRAEDNKQNDFRFVTILGLKC